MVYMFGIEFSIGMFLMYVGLQAITSFATPGIPGGGSELPVWVAAGLPLEGYALVRAIYTIPDIFVTTANVTGIMTIVALVSTPPTNEFA